VLFAPTVAELYPSGVEELFQLQVPAALQAVLCGRRRPGHFNGVATVVARMLVLVRPDRLLLGEKDWQQLVILRRLVNDLGLPVAVQGCATVRDADGLALSSRNRYLSAEDRRHAAGFPTALRAAADKNSPEEVAATAKELITRQTGSSPEYVAVVDAETLQPMTALDRPAVLAAAVKIGETRLIDNVRLAPRHAKI
jgi:pantoate ligase/cytidylate kinase